MQRPGGVGQHGAAEQHDVGPVIGDDFGGMFGGGDHADGAGGDAGLGADRLGEGHVVAGVDRGDVLLGGDAAGGAVDQVDLAGGLEHFRDLDGVGQGVPAGGPVGAGQAHPERQLVGPFGAGGLDDLHQHPAAALEVAAVLVVAGVGQRREEGVHQVAVGGVQLDQLEPGQAAHPHGGGELLDDALDFGCAECGRGGVAVGEGDGAGADRLPAALGDRDWLAAVPGAADAGLAPGMAELDGGDGAAMGDDAGEAAEQVLVRRVVGAQALFGDPPDCRDMGRLGHHDAGAAHRLGAELLDVPVVAEPVGGAVLAHRGDADAVAGGDRA